MNKISFFNADKAPRLKLKESIRAVLNELFKRETHTLKRLNYIFCSDEYLLRLNNGYLNHNTLTDVITFPLSESGEPIDAEIYISVDRIEENSVKFKEKFDNELLRVMIHGALHLCGYRDKSKTEKEEMRKWENFYLRRLHVSRESK